MTKKKIILLVALLVLLALILILRKPRPQRAKVAPVSQAPPTVEKEKSPLLLEETLPSLEVRKVKGPVAWGRDPFFSPLVKETPEEEALEVGALILTGIVRDKKGAQAIIGDYIVNIGDVINGKRVISITENEVVLMKAKEKEILKLEEEE